LNALSIPTCPTCNAPAEFLPTSERIYRGRDYGPLWACVPCDTYVGVHEGTRIPKGTLATKPMREARKTAHIVFDELWLELSSAYPDIARPNAHLRSIARKRAYAWLAAQLGISVDDCHIGMFDVVRCADVVQIITERKPTSATVREWFKSQQGQAAES